MTANPSPLRREKVRKTEGGGETAKLRNVNNDGWKVGGSREEEEEEKCDSRQPLKF